MSRAKPYVRSRGGRWGPPKIHRESCQYALYGGYEPIAASDIKEDDILCKVCNPTRPKKEEEA